MKNLLFTLLFAMLLLSCGGDNIPELVEKLNNELNDGESNSNQNLIVNDRGGVTCLITSVRISKEEQEEIMSHEPQAKQMLEIMACMLQVSPNGVELLKELIANNKELELRVTTQAVIGESKGYTEKLTTSELHDILKLTEGKTEKEIQLLIIEKYGMALGF